MAGGGNRLAEDFDREVAVRRLLDGNVSVGDRLADRMAEVGARGHAQHLAIAQNALAADGAGAAPSVICLQRANGRAALLTSSSATCSSTLRASGPHRLMTARADVTSRMIALPSGGRWLRSQCRSCGPKALPVTM